MDRGLDSESVVGRIGHVVVTIPGGDRPGEVIVQVRGGTERYIAYCEDPVERGQVVLITADRGGRSVDVIST